MENLITKLSPDPIITKPPSNYTDDGKPKRKQIEAYVTTFGNEDVVRDVIAPGALDRFVDGFKGDLPMLLNHDVSQIVGLWKGFEIDDYGVKGTGEFNNTQLGQDTEMLVNDGVLNAVSIGFKATDYETRENGGRTFKEISLFETSVVLFPANRQAEITSIKDDDGQIDMVKLEQLLRKAELSRNEAKRLVHDLKATLRKAEEVNTKQSIVTNLSELLSND